MALNQLPTEIIWIIASCFCQQGDIFALVQTSRQLYKTLIKFLYCFHGQYKHGIGLCFVAERNLVPQVRGLLDGMKTARDYSQPSDVVQYTAEDKVLDGFQDDDTLSSEAQLLYGPGNLRSQDVYTHTIFQQG
jgi:hypothetical protein